MRNYKSFEIPQVATQQRKYDIALFNIALDMSIYDFRMLPFDRAETEKSRKTFWDPGLGDEVVTVGLYTSHYGQTKNIPVVRVGHLAALPDEPVRTEFGYAEAYLIETKSIAGLSGSPVFVSVPSVVFKNGQLLQMSVAAHPILGLLIGYHVVESKEDQIVVPQFQGAKSASADGGIDERNTGFAVVIPIERIFDILESAPVVAGQQAWIKHHMETGFRAASATSHGSPEAEVSVEPATDNPSHKEDFMSLLNAASKAKQ